MCGIVCGVHVVQGVRVWCGVCVCIMYLFPPNPASRIDKIIPLLNQVTKNVVFLFLSKFNNSRKVQF